MTERKSGRPKVADEKKHQIVTLSVYPRHIDYLNRKADELKSSRSYVAQRVIDNLIELGK